MRRSAGKPKTGRTPKKQSAPPAKRSRKQAALEEEIDSGDSGDDEAAQHAAALAAEPDDEAEAETAQERRVRLAREMIGKMDDAARRRQDAETDEAEDVVAQSLEEDALRKAGRFRVEIGAALRGHSVPREAVRTLRGPRLSPTCVALVPDESAAFCGCKDGSISRWDLGSGQRTLIPSGRGGEGRPGHKRDVLSATVSPDGRLLVTGSRDQTILMWDIRTLQVRVG
eukprot:3584266-Prymnesium_polylepis.1